VGEGEKFEVTVSYDIPEDAGQQILQCEMKDKDSVNVLKAQSPRVKGKGEKTLTFVAPKMDQMEAIVMACWAGTDWQNPVAPIKFSDPIPVVEKRSAPQPKEEKKEASKSEETSKISVESVSKLEIFSKSEVKESGEPPGKEATCAIADLPGEVVEGKEFMTTVEYSIPSSAGKARLNCEMKDMSNNVLKSESPEVKGKGKATFSFTAPVLSTGQVVIAAWLGQDWQQPLAPIQFSEPIPITGKEMSGMPGGKPDVEKGKNGSIAVFRDSLPGMDGTGIADAVVTGLRGSGFGVTVLDSEKIRNSSILNIENFDCLVIAGGADYFPASASASLLRFLTRGGDLVTLGGYAFKELVWNFNGKWMTKSQIEETISSVQPQNMLFDFEDEPSGWRRATNDVSTPGSLEADKGYKGKGAKIFIPGLTGWDNWSAGIDGSISEGQDLVCFWAKGSQRTKQIAVEIGERDGSRWIATVNMGTEWKHYCLLPEAFAYWKDNTSKGRGGKGVSDIAEHMFDVAPMPPVQQGFMKVSADKKHLVYPDGKRFFCIGSNYHGWFDRCWNEWKEYFDPVKMELDFRKAHEAGINTFRLFLYKLADDIMKDDFHKIDIMLTFARRYDIHLLVHLARYGQMEKSQECIRKLCAHLKDEPMVLGYDIQNEPWLPAIIAEKYPAGIKLPITDIQDGVNKFGIYVGENLGEWTTFPKLKDNKVPMLDDEVVKAGDESFRIWIKLNKDAIREVDKNHLVTVGFNTPFSAFPCASELDFISHHVYVRPFSYDSVIQNITTFDRIAAVWPEKPVSFGEFGYSNGIMMGSRYLDFYSSAVGEMIHYLYPLSRGYEGSYKWMLNDNPNAWRGDDNFYEERFGFFYYDGTPFGHRKPIAHATQFLSEYINRAGPTGTMETAQAQNMIGTGYVFKGDKALFIGNTEYKSDGLQFKGGKPANVMLDWGSGKLKIMSTCDLQVKISPSKFLSTLKSGSKITGRNAGSKKDGDLLILDLLEGEAVTIQ